MNSIETKPISNDLNLKIQSFLKQNKITSILELEILFLFNKNSYQEFNLVMLEEKLHVERSVINLAVEKLNKDHLIRVGRAIHQDECYSIVNNKEVKNIIDSIENEYTISFRNILNMISDVSNN